MEPFNKLKIKLKDQENSKSKTSFFLFLFWYGLLKCSSCCYISIPASNNRFMTKTLPGKMDSSNWYNGT